MIALKFFFLICSCCCLVLANPTLNSERISTRKCKEYAKVTMKTNHVMSLPNLPIRRVLNDRCLHRSIPLVVGGTEAKMSEFPHQALLGYEKYAGKQWLCGGSLVSINFILTAAHCLRTPHHGPVKYAKLGMNSRTQVNRVSTFGIEESIAHPDYKIRPFHNDIALLRLNSTVNFTEHLYPICLPISLPNNTRAIVTGFGQSGRQESVTEVLMKVILEKFSYEECKKLFKVVNLDQNSMICFGNRTFRGDACRGDSGGPVQVGNDEVAKCTYKILGVISFGAQDCGTPGVPSVYMNVYHYLGWIEGIVWGDEV